MALLSTQHDQGPTARIRSGLFWIYLKATCYRYACHLQKRTLPESAHDVDEEAMRAKAAASIASAGVLFGFVAAALAAAVASEEARKEFRLAWEVLRVVGPTAWVSLFFALGLPYSIVWQERYISMASVRCKPREEDEEKEEKTKAKLTDEELDKLRKEEAKLRRNRTWVLLALLGLAFVFFLIPVWYQPPVRSRLSGLFLTSALELSGLILIVLSLFFLFFALEFYDTASGWRGGEKLHFHLAGIASHSFTFGATLALVGLSLLFTVLDESPGRAMTFLSLLVTASVTEIERFLFLYHRKRLTQKSEPEKK